MKQVEINTTNRVYFYEFCICTRNSLVPSKYYKYEFSNLIKEKQFSLFQESYFLQKGIVTIDRTTYQRILIGTHTQILLLNKMTKPTTLIIYKS